jgi:hypothetical protein
MSGLDAISFAAREAASWPLYDLQGLNGLVRFVGRSGHIDVAIWSAARDPEPPPGSFRLDPELLNDWRPFLDFSLLIGGKRLGRLLVAAINLKPEVSK